MGKEKANDDGPYWVRLCQRRRGPNVCSGFWSTHGSFRCLAEAKWWANRFLGLVMSSSGKILHCADKRESVLREVERHNAALSRKGAR